MEGDSAQEYAGPDRFFASTYPTKGIRSLLHHVLARLGGKNNYAVFWLNTSFGGGKTHALIALLHAARSPQSAAVSEFIDRDLLPEGSVRIAVFDGQSADISSGHDIGDGVRARTPWGEIAYRLAGKDGYRRVDDRETGSAPGDDTIMELIGDRSVLILLDEIAVYLRKAARHEGAGRQFSAFLTALISAVNRSPNAALVYTLAAGKEANAYSEENRRIMAELANISARTATLLNPTEEGETVQILRRRLFESRDESGTDAAVDAYRRIWKSNMDRLPDVAGQQKTVEEFRAGYPLHPEILATLISKTSTLEDFQRVRGMLRLLAHIVHDLWTRRDRERPTAIHLHHFDMGNEAIRLEITSKLKQEAFAAAIDIDIACDDANKTSLAQRLDWKHYQNMTPFTTYIARTIFMHTLAYNQQLRGIDDKRLRYSILYPGMETGYVDEALARFREQSLYLDDNAEKPTQFQAEPNLNQAIQRAEQGLDVPDLEREIDERLRTMFGRGEFSLHQFPDGHGDVPDGSGRPLLVMPRYSGAFTPNPESPPELVTDIFLKKSIDGIRMHRNNLVFLVAYENAVGLMYDTARRHLAMSGLAAPDSLTTFADYQQNDIRKRTKESDAELDEAILGCYKYAYYPIRQDRLKYITMDWTKAGRDGQGHLVSRLRDAGKLRTSRDGPDNPKSLVDRISGLKKGKITARAFRDEFYRNTDLPMLVGDEVFRKGIKTGIDMGEFVYKRGDLLCGNGDPSCEIVIDSDSSVYTAKRASSLGIWPRKKEGKVPEPKDPPKKDPPKERLFDISSVRESGKPVDAVRNVLGILRKNGVGSISTIRIESRDNVFPFLSVAGRIRGCEAVLEIDGSYETDAGGAFRFDFTGSLIDAAPVLEFVKQQVRVGRTGNINARLDMHFKDSINVDWFETLAARLKLVDNDIRISDIAGGLEEDRPSRRGVQT